MLMLTVPALIGVLTVSSGRFALSADDLFGRFRPVQLTSAVVSTHSTKGVVKAIDAHTLVIVRSVRRGKEMTFVLDSSTRREGRVTVGAMVEVRYRTEASRRVAAVISAGETTRQ
jgi:hypothetical protein